MTRFPYHTLYCQVRSGTGGYQKRAVMNLKGLAGAGGEGSLLQSLSRESKDTDSPSSWVQKNLSPPQTLIMSNRYEPPLR